MLGPERPPQLEDQQLLPYTNAVLHEVQRFITLLPHVPRCTATDMQLGTYLLPKVGWPGPTTTLSPPGPQHLWWAGLGTSGTKGARGRQERGFRRRAALNLSPGASSQQIWVFCVHKVGWGAVTGPC